MTTEELNIIIAKAEAGDVAAMNQLGLIYGQDEYKDLSKAFYWISKSAEAGDIIGMSNLGGWCYMYGNGVEKNIPLAIEWLEKAANMNNVWSMNRLTTLYGTFEDYINHEQAAKWFLELIKRDCDPNSGVYEKTGYNKDLYAKIKNAVQNSTTEEEMMSAMSGGNGNSLLGGAISFTTSNAKSYINQAEAAIQRNIEYKEEQRRKAEEEAARKRAEEERARREAEERALREREERERQEAEKADLIRKIEADYEKGDVRPLKYISGTFVIPEGTKRIGNRAFWNCSSLTSVTIPNSVKTIGERAFLCCSGLTNVTIPDSVTKIGERAFKDCTGLKSVTIPISVKSIETWAFYGCRNVKIYTPKENKERLKKMKGVRVFGVSGVWGV